MSQYPSGVPSPFTMHVHPYPTRFHGGIWRRPVFGQPWVRQPFNVIRPSQMAASQHAPPRYTKLVRSSDPQAGLGLDWDTGTGVFRRPRADGGGVFNEISGLGSMTTATSAFVGGAVVAFGVVYYLLKNKKAGG